MWHSHMLQHFDFLDIGEQIKDTHSGQPSVNKQVSDLLSLNFICFSLLIGGRSCILDNTRVALTGFPNFSSFSENLILSEGSWRLSSCYLELSSFVFYLYLIVFRYSCGVTMPTTRSSSVHSEINAAGSPLAVQLAVHTSSTPSTVPMITPSTSVGSSSTTSILSPDVHLLLQIVQDYLIHFKVQLLQPLQQFNCTNASEFLAWARRVQEHLRYIPCFSSDILIKPREEISFSVCTDQIESVVQIYQSQCRVVIKVESYH